MAMNPEFKNKWLEALRSGEYKKTIGTLYEPKENAYCCLGVAAAIFGVDPKENINAADDVIYCEDINPIGLTILQIAKIWRFNDTEAHRDNDFNRVADYIEGMDL